MRTLLHFPGPASLAAAAGVSPDPAFALRGLLWDYRRIGAPAAWRVTTGRPGVTVGVADTGLDYTHFELRDQVAKVVDFADRGKPVCKVVPPGTTDRQIARKLGVPVNLDFNGHGSWIGGNIAAAQNGKGTNGIAPGVKLVSLKIGGWCGFGWDSDIIHSFVYAAKHGIDVVNNSFGGYLDRSRPFQNALYEAYVRAVRFARSKGTTIVASAGNEHTRIGAAGRVLTHGTLTIPGQPVFDAFGRFEVPGGVPGVVDVSATGNRVNAPSRHCPKRTLQPPTFETCKPKSDPEQSFGVGHEDQLTYYSNYGPRIDVAAPGGARKFNLPNYDRGGTPGFPYTKADGTRVWETFSITSNFALEIPCFTFPAGGPFPAKQCYTTIQGTSMAAPHVAASLALIASAMPELQHRPAALIARLKATTRHPHNLTPPLSATDHRRGLVKAVSNKPCSTGFCHLGGAPISDSDAYGAGLIDVGRAVRR